MPEHYIGVMSGTSMDAIDAVLVDFAENPCQIIATHSQPIPQNLRDALGALCIPADNEINRLGKLDHQMGLLFADTVNQLLEQASIEPAQIKAIGSHGQTIRHHPTGPMPFSLQIADPNLIAEKTGITTIADFRRRDIANGGQGAPLTPSFHDYLFRDTTIDRVILNIGGIANITLLPAGQHSHIIGFDTGPGNTLLDAWAYHVINHSYDKDGLWGMTGQCNEELLQTLLADAYFDLPPPKSTGREYFNLKWLREKIPANSMDYRPEDTQKTLTEFTAITIMSAIDKYSAAGSQILACGGGSYNSLLMKSLDDKRGSHTLHTTEEFGLPAAWVEAVAFAWLAKQTLQRQPINLSAVTGAKKSSILGGIYYS